MIYKRPEVEAIDDYLKAAALGYKISDSYYNLGLSCIFKDDAMAIVYFQKCLREKPDNPDVLYLIATCQKRLRKRLSN